MNIKEINQNIIIFMNDFDLYNYKKKKFFNKLKKRETYWKKRVQLN